MTGVEEEINETIWSAGFGGGLAKRWVECIKTAQSLLGERENRWFVTNSRCFCWKSVKFDLSSKKGNLLVYRKLCIEIRYSCKFLVWTTDKCEKECKKIKILCFHCFQIGLGWSSLIRSCLDGIQVADAQFDQLLNMQSVNKELNHFNAVFVMNTFCVVGSSLKSRQRC